MADSSSADSWAARGAAAPPARSRALSLSNDAGLGSPLSPSSGSLTRSLGLWDLVSIGVGGVIGAGIFVLTGVAAAECAGPAIVLSFLLSATCCGFTALCYSELSSMVPNAGSAYAFASAALGERLGFLVGFDLVLEYTVGAAAVSVGWSAYVRSALRDAGVALPPALARAPFSYDTRAQAWVATGGAVDALAVALVAATTAVLARGIGESARVATALVVLKIVVLLLFIAGGAAHVRRENYEPFIPPPGAEFGEFGLSGILRGASIVFFSYVGFDSLSTAAAEAVDPQRTVPLATLITLAACTALYVGTAAVMTGLTPYTTLGVADPVAVAVDAAGPALAWLRPVVKVGAVAGLTSVVLVLLYSQSRILFAMARDGMLPRALAAVSPTTRAPTTATYATAAATAVLAGVLPIDVLGEMVSIGTLFAFILVCGGVAALRRTQPGLARPFRAPGGDATPAVGAAVCLAQMVALPAATWVRFIVWQLLGVAVYYGFSVRHRAEPFEARRAALLGLPPPPPAAAAAATAAAAAAEAAAAEAEPATSPTPGLTRSPSADEGAPLVAAGAGGTREAAAGADEWGVAPGAWPPTHAAPLRAAV